MHLEETVHISPQGQITLPASIREILRGDTVRLVVEDDSVRLESPPQWAGSLKRYAGEYIPLETIREQIWSEVADEDHPGR
jgi:bifunctional DNA-binding transcriptional regulator/antitoxin component of YhaV-PrlF toxin-antitoxin module